MTDNAVQVVQHRPNIASAIREEHRRRVLGE
jgi:hypothetical protein